MAAMAKASREHSTNKVTTSSNRPKGANECNAGSYTSNVASDAANPR